MTFLCAGCMTRYHGDPLVDFAWQCDEPGCLTGTLNAAPTIPRPVAVATERLDGRPESRGSGEPRTQGNQLDLLALAVWIGGAALGAAVLAMCGYFGWFVASRGGLV